MNNFLKDKNIIFLGSSVTRGYASNGISFVEILSNLYHFNFKKEAVDRTSLTKGDLSYCYRLKKLKVEKCDLFVLQLSCNDAFKNSRIGNIDDNDDNSVLGAINFIKNYVKDHFNCPLVIFTNPYFENDIYKKMVESIKKIKDIYIMDLYNDKEFNNKFLPSYMLDNIHPTLKGYKEWFAPYLFDKLNEIMKQNSN